MNSRPEWDGGHAEPGELQAQLTQTRHELAGAESERQAARDREAVLRNELQRRVRNMLAIIRSIFSRTLAAGGSLDHVADHFDGRLDAIARFQTMWSLDPSGTVDLERILRDELQSFQFGDDPRIGIAGPDVRLAPDIAQALSLALHELVTNSIKFGVLTMIEARGKLSVSWIVSEGKLRFTWLETGVSVLSSAPPRHGFGRQFLEQALPYQLGADTQFELRPGGLFCEIIAPLDPAEHRTGAATRA